MRGFHRWGWHLDEIHVKLNREMGSTCGAPWIMRVRCLDSYDTRASDKRAALTFMKKALKGHGSPEAIATAGLRS
jgi:putative transposase